MKKLRIMFIGLFFFIFFTPIIGAFTEEISSLNYSTLAPYHVQQDRPTGCSLASSLVMLNAQRQQYMSQQAMRNWLKSHKSGSILSHWAHSTDYGGSGVTFKTLPKYLSKVIEEFGLKATIESFPRGKFSLSQFMIDIKSANDNQNVYILINYPDKGYGHWSPLAKYNQNTKEMSILNVNFDNKFGEEYYYQEGQGLDTVSAEKFFKKWGSRRGYLKITFH